MGEILLLFCIFCNFFSSWFIPFITGGFSEGNVFNTASYATINEAYVEMIIVFIILCIVTHIIRRRVSEGISPHRDYYQSAEFRRIVFYIYIIFIAYTLITTNWSFNTENRGVHQFELEGRQTLAGGIAGVFFVPFLLYIYILRSFGKKTLRYIILGIFVYSLNGIASGGRSNVVNALLAFIIFFYYVEKIETKYFYVIIVVGLLTFSLTASDRFSDTGQGVVMDNVVKLLQMNGSSWFLPMIKKTMAMGIELSPWIFFMHFATIFVPSFIWVRFGQLSYTRSTFVFNDLYNTSQSGLGFMMLGDFYWCFGYLGYLLYICVFIYVLVFFRKHIKSPKPYMCIGAINMMYWFCNQRADFGAFLKPTLYTIIFIWLLEWLRKYYIRNSQVLVTKRKSKANI